MMALLDRTVEDAAVVARVRSADGIVWGKTNTPVYASRLADLQFALWDYE
jgi:Asp-tRNA(Asn)/Glu-tRNA(Gln) amidotransferase A subunit family amidase